MTPSYTMGFMQPVAPARCQALLDGTLDIDDIVLLVQDLLEIGKLPSPVFYNLAEYFVEIGLCTVTGRLYQ